MNRAWKHFDIPLIAFAAAISLVGIFAIFDAGYARSLATGKGPIPREFAQQLGFCVASFLIAAGTAFVNVRFWKRAAGVIWAVSLLLLLAVEKFGHEQNGAQRWIKIAGIPVQPAEFVKLATVIYLASVFANRAKWPTNIPRRKSFDHWLDTIAMPKLKRAMPAIMIAIAAVFIEREKDLGTAAVVASISFGMFFIAGVSRNSLIAIVVLSVAGAGAMIAKEPYRWERISQFQSRWQGDNVDDSGYQTVQSQLAMASGGVAGVGIGNGRAKHVLPATTTDFVMATVSEEFGLLGTWTILGLLALLVMRLFALAQKATTRFGMLICYGVAIWMGIQGCVNLLMANGTLPAIGIPFPFVSSGGSSLIALWLALGLCQAALVPIPVKEESHAPSRDRGRNRRTHLSRA